jgi:hypothetical protein
MPTRQQYERLQRAVEIAEEWYALAKRQAASRGATTTVRHKCQSRYSAIIRVGLHEDQWGTALRGSRTASSR